jgi:UTP--glucose-1-phosphate uridylyltransferase
MVTRHTPGSFEIFEEKMRAEDLPAIAIENFRHYYRKLVQGETGLVRGDEIEPVERLPDSRELGGFQEKGVLALAKTVVIKLNGGLGTSMGMKSAKSLLPVKDGKSFLDLTAQQILALGRAHGCRLPLILMNSFRTRDDSLAVLAKYPELGTSLPLDFVQHKIPKIRADDLTPVRWPSDPEHEWCPPGHGDTYAALVTSGILPQLLEQGYEYAFVSNSDNLGAVLDLGILGYFASGGSPHSSASSEAATRAAGSSSAGASTERVPFLMEVTERTEADRKGGHLARRKEGGLLVREVAQCPQDEIESFEDVSLFKYFNTNTLWLNLPALARTLEERNCVLGLPMIRNQKTVDPTREDSPKVYQLETAIGAAISVFEGAQAIRVPRERFIPVKTTNDLLALWSDAYVLTPDARIAPAPSRGMGDLVVDLDPRYFKRIDQLEERFPFGAPSLLGCKRLQIRGDFRFGRNAVFRGEVRLENRSAEPRRVPDGEVFG